MNIEIQDLVPYINNGGSYYDLCNNEVGFLTRIYGGFFHQEALELQKSLKTNDEIFLRKDIDNKYDCFATEVLTKEGKFLGYLKKDLAAEIIDINNYKVKIRVPYDGLTTGNRNSLGSEIIIVNLKKLEDAKA